MSRAFVKDADYLEELPERPVSEHPNDVTEAGLAQIEHALAAASEAYAAAQALADRAALAAAARDLRYWSARRATARVVPAPTDYSEVRFGTSVTIVRDDGREQTFRIVGEDEADPPKARSHMSRRWRDRCSESASATWSEPATGKPRTSGSSDQFSRALQLGRGMQAGRFRL
jgi:transcription elongation GreA/GreB family factor